ncbi:hypothetical protein TNCV_4698851 [Trichonephila clavipes]|nr:hypothetical protein TNCV_4698851 [Trichonephila clavipes]
MAGNAFDNAAFSYLISWIWLKKSRTQGLRPEFGLSEKPKRAATSKTDMTSEKQDAQTILMTPTVLAESRKPTIFKGEPGQDPIKWLKE